MNVGLDLGNLAVGVATALVAIVTMIISNRNFGDLRRHKLADLRNAWLDDLRSHLASFAGNVTSISVSEDKLDQSKQDKIFYDVFYIQLKLASSSKAPRLIELMHDMQKYAIEERVSKFGDLLDEYVSLSQQITLDAWSDVQNELGIKAKERKKCL